MRLLKKTAILVAGAALVGGLPAARAAIGPVPDLTVAAARDTEPVVLKGDAFGAWAAPAEVTAKVPATGGKECIGGVDEASCTHNQYETPEVATGAALGEGTPIDKLIGYRWHPKAKKFVQIPFQVDEMAERYLSNNNSGFAFYSETDKHLTYVWDQERFRWTADSAGNPCVAAPRDGIVTTPDSVPGLDTDDEIAFMASDAGPEAPAGAALPKHTTEMKRVTVADPSAGGVRGYVYVALAGDKGPDPEYDGTNGYVRYEPDADSDTYLFSESSYEDYGATYHGAYVDEETGVCVTDPSKFKQRRPKDTASVRTPRYAFRYDGRWLMTELRAAKKGTDWQYGPDLVDQWKARAFQQRPGGETPCCGYEEEVNNWGGSSMLFGVRSGPVRLIRASWGSDSATNNVKTEVFYRDEIRQLFNLRVHVIPPFDGIYAQWDYNAGKITRYYNPYQPDGVTVDGKNDEVFGNTHMRVAHDGVHVEDKDPIPVVGEQSIGDGRSRGSCPDPDEACVNNDVDIPDPTFSGVNPGLNYEQVTGPFGTLVHRTRVTQPTAGTAHSAVTVPYYRDDACFDDGTGTDPGPHLDPADPDPTTFGGVPRECWDPSMGDPLSVVPREHLYQGSIGTHGIHIELIADSDNATMPVPLTEIDSETRIVVLPGTGAELGNVGEQYGRGVEKPLVAVVA